MDYNKVLTAPILDEKCREHILESITDERSLPFAPLMATVISSGKLNVRESPDKLSDVVCVVNRGDVLIVADADANDSWVFVQTNSGFIGYAMREYIGPTWYE